MPFEVVDLHSPYHAPAYFKFMARPCYIYLKLKMPGPKGVITVNGSRQMALEYEQGDAAMAETACVWGPQTSCPKHPGAYNISDPMISVSLSTIKLVSKEHP